MQVVAEGVETRRQLEILREHGCHQAQGYYFSRLCRVRNSAGCWNAVVEQLAYA